MLPLRIWWPLVTVSLCTAAAACLPWRNLRLVGLHLSNVMVLLQLGLYWLRPMHVFGWLVLRLLWQCHLPVVLGGGPWLCFVVHGL